MADPTKTRYFYADAKRRRSGASNHVRPAEGKDNLGGQSYIQGNSITSILAPRGMLPIIGRNKYKTIALKRIEGDTTKNRTIFSSDDTGENNFFLDSDRISTARYKAFLSPVTRENVQGFVLPDGSIIADPDNLLQDIFFDSIKPKLESEGFIDFSGKIPVPEQHKPAFLNYDFIYLKTTEPFTLNVTFPNGGIQQVVDNTIDLTVYGNDVPYDRNTPFTELQKFNAIEFIENNAPLGMFPETSKSPSYSSDAIYNGIIEPFSIRAGLYGKEIFAADDRKPGALDGAVTDPIEFSYSVSETTKGAHALLQDVANAHNGLGFLSDFFVSETTFRPDAYEDRDPYDSVYVDEELENVLISMDTTLDEGNLSVLHIDMTVGFDGAAKDRFGSLVYRGMLR